MHDTYDTCLFLVESKPPLLQRDILSVPSVGGEIVWVTSELKQIRMNGFCRFTTHHTCNMEDEASNPRRIISFLMLSLNSLQNLVFSEIMI